MSALCDVVMFLGDHDDDDDDDNNNNEKRSERRKHCALAVVRQSQNISPRRRPPSRGRGTAKI